MRILAEAKLRIINNDIFKNFKPRKETKNAMAKTAINLIMMRILVQTIFRMMIMTHFSIGGKLLLFMSSTIFL